MRKIGGEVTREICQLVSLCHATKSTLQIKLVEHHVVV